MGAEVQPTTASTSGPTYFIEVVDPETGKAVPDGEIGTLCVTPLWTDQRNPFLRWNSGDLISLVPRSKGSGTATRSFR